MGFKEWLNLIEIFGSFNYKVPEDKEEQLYDFYMMSFLRGLSSYDIQRSSFRAQTGYDVRSFSVLRPDPGEMDNEDKIDYMLKEVETELLPALKQNLLSAVFFSLCSEFRHVLDKNNPKELVDLAKTLSDNYGEGMRSYLKRTALYQSQSSSSIMRTPQADHPDIASSVGDQTSSRSSSYYAALKSGLTKSAFVNLMQEMYSKAKWNPSYGGPAWTRICEGWSKLNEARNNNELIIWIDHIYDLQHNTDTVFNKLESYAKDGNYSWLKKALDHKARIKEPHEIIDKVSGSMRQLSMRAIKTKTGKSYEEFMKEKSDKKLVGGWSLDDTLNTSKLGEIPPAMDALGYDKPEKTQEEKERELGKALKEMFNRFEGPDALRIARILLNNGWQFEQLKGEKMMPFDMLNILYKVTGWQAGHGDQEVLDLYDQEKKLQDGLHQSGMLSTSFAKISEMPYKTLSDMVVGFKNYNPYITPETLEKIHELLGLNGSQYIQAIKAFREKTGYNLASSKVYVMLAYARILLDAKREPVDGIGYEGSTPSSPEPKVQHLPGENAAWKMKTMQEMNGYDGTWTTRWARWILSNQGFAKHFKGITAVVVSLSKQLGVVLDKSQTAEIIESYYEEDNLQSYYSELKNLPTIGEIIKFMPAQLKQWQNNLGPINIQLGAKAIKEAQQRILANQIIPAIKILRIATGWNLIATKRLAEHLAIITFAQHEQQKAVHFLHGVGPYLGQ